MGVSIGAGKVSLIRMKESAAPGSPPPSGYVYKYNKSDHRSYRMGADGVEHEDGQSTPAVPALLSTVMADGTTNDLAQAQADLAAVGSSTHRHLILPAGTIELSATTGSLLNSAADDLVIEGAGIGRTILRLPAVSLTGNLNVLNLTGKRQQVRNLTIQIVTGTDNGFKTVGLQVNAGAYAPLIENVEIIGGYGPASAGGAGLSLYQPWNQTEATTTLGTTIVAGTRTVTPGSMAGIYVGRRLTIGGTSEDVIVTAVSTTTFTAVFANAHNAADAVTISSFGWQGATVRNCYVHDVPYGQGVVNNARGNIFEGVIVRSIGSTAAQHCFYDQAGDGVYLGCWAEGANGYNWHFHHDVPHIEASGAKMIGCMSLNAGFQHLICDGSTEDGTNPQIPNGAYSTRYMVISGCVFRQTSGAGVTGVNLGIPAIFIGNTLEDTWANGSVAINAQNDCIITGNVIRQLLYAGGGNFTAIQTSNGPSLVSDNKIFLGAGGGGITLGAGGTARGNEIVLTDGTGIGANNDTIIADNQITVSTGRALALTNCTGLSVRGNKITVSGGGTVTIISHTATAGLVADNVWSGQFSHRVLCTGLILRDNAGQVTYYEQSASTLKPGTGRLLVFNQTSTPQAAAGYGMKWDGAGGIVRAGTADTAAMGIAVSTGGDPAPAPVYCVVEVGAECPIEMDGAWTDGHFAILSVTSGGKWHDAGAGVPASGSYCWLRGTGGGAGTAQAVVMKLL